MTREEKIDAFAMRLDGFTYEEIGQKYGMSRERVRQIFANVTAESGRPIYEEIPMPPTIFV